MAQTLTSAPAAETSPERAALAAAIERKRQVRALVDATNEALHRAVPARRVAAAKVTEAEQALEAAKRAAAERLTGIDGAPSISIRDARAAVADARDEHEAAADAVTALEAQLDKVTTSHNAHDVHNAVLRAAAAVLGSAPAVATLAADVDRLQRDLSEKAQVLIWLRQVSALPPSMGGVLGAFTQEMTASEMGASHPGARPTLKLLIRHTEPVVWKTALIALESDADAAVPGDAA